MMIYKQPQIFLCGPTMKTKTSDLIHIENMTLKVMVLEVAYIMVKMNILSLLPKNGNYEHSYIVTIRMVAMNILTLIP